MIDKVFILNLERRADKWWFMLGALRALNFPFDGTCQPWGDTIVRFAACDGVDILIVIQLRRLSLMMDSPASFHQKVKTSFIWRGSGHG